MYNTVYAPELDKKIKELAEKLTIIDKDPNYSVINNGVVLPRRFLRGGGYSQEPYQGRGGVVDTDGKFVEESAVYDLINSYNQSQLLAFGGSYEYNHSETAEKNLTAIYLGFANTHWGHFLIDVIQRTWILLRFNMLKNYHDQHGYTNDISIDLSNYVLVFSGDENNKVELGRNHKEFFTLLGVNTDVIQIIDVPTKFDTIIVPDIAVYPGKYVHAVYREIIDIVIDHAMYEMKKNANSLSYEKVYFSRMHLNNIQEIGEKPIENLMAKCGFEILYPEEMSLKEQIYCWQTANQIACINGTIPHSCIFARKHLNLYVFCKMKKMVGYQFTMDKIWGEENTVTYISAYKEPYSRYPLTVSRGPFWITINNNVARFANDIFGILINPHNRICDFINYHVACLYVEVKYHFRGIRSKLKTIRRKDF